MSAENGIPVDKCPKCGMDRRGCLREHRNYYCDTWTNNKTNIVGIEQSTACKRIAELQEQVKERELMLKDYSKRIEKQNKRAIDMLDEAYETGRNDGYLHQPRDKETRDVQIRSNGFREITERVRGLDGTDRA